jgi:hypothetical protein
MIVINLQLQEKKMKYGVLNLAERYQYKKDHPEKSRINK